MWHIFLCTTLAKINKKLLLYIYWHLKTTRCIILIQHVHRTIICYMKHSHRLPGNYTAQLENKQPHIIVTYLPVHGLCPVEPTSVYRYCWQAFLESTPYSSFEVDNYLGDFWVVWQYPQHFLKHCHIVSCLHSWHDNEKKWDLLHYACRFDVAVHTK